MTEKRTGAWIDRARNLLDSNESELDRAVVEHLSKLYANSISSELKAARKAQKMCLKSGLFPSAPKQ